MSSMILILALVAAGGGNDALDFIPTDVYWRTKTVAVSVETMAAESGPVDGPAPDISRLIENLASDSFHVRQATSERIAEMGTAVVPQLREATKSRDPEVVARAERLLGGFSGQTASNSVRRLMAIRTLGELKKPEAIELLRPLLRSKELFVAEYAERSIAMISGQAAKSRRPSDDQLMSDVWLLPSGCGLVGQVKQVGDLEIDIRKVIGHMAVGPMQGAAGQGNVDQLNAFLPLIIAQIEKIGNVRVDAVTLGVAQDIDGDAGFVVCVLRGQYDTAVVRALFEGMGLNALEDEPILRSDDEVAILMPSGDRLVFIAAPGQGALPTARTVLGNIEGGKVPLKGNKEMVGMIEAMDRSGLLWATTRVPRSFKREVPFAAPFETAALTGSLKDGGVDLALTASGADREQVKASSEQIDQMVKTQLVQLKQFAAQMPPMAVMFRPMIDFMESIRPSADDGKLSITASFNPDMNQLMTMPMMMFGIQARPDFEME